MYNIKIDYRRIRFNFFVKLFYFYLFKFLTSGKFFGNIVGKYLIIRQILQTCEISKNYLKPLCVGSQRDVRRVRCPWQWLGFC